MKRILIAMMLSLILASSLTMAVEAAPSAETYMEVINSIPALGSSVRSLPEYITPQKAGPYIIAFDGTYGELEIHGDVEPYSGMVTFLVIKPAAGNADTSGAAGFIADALRRKYGQPSTVVPGETYLWSQGRLQLQYAIRSGIVTGNY